MPDTLPTHDLPSNRTGRILQLHPRASRRIGAAAIASHGIFWKTTKRVSGSLKPLVKNAVFKKRCFIVICLAYLFFSKAQDLFSFHNRWVSTGENGFFVWRLEQRQTSTKICKVEATTREPLWTLELHYLSFLALFVMWLLQYILFRPFAVHNNYLHESNWLILKSNNHGNRCCFAYQTPTIFAYKPNSKPGPHPVFGRESPSRHVVQIRDFLYFTHPGQNIRTPSQGGWSMSIWYSIKLCQIF